MKLKKFPVWVFFTIVICLVIFILALTFESFTGFSIFGFGDSPEACLSVSIPREIYTPGETLQAEITIAGPVETLKRENILFQAESGNKIELPFKLSQLSKRKYFFSVDIPELEDGEYMFKVNALCEKAGKIEQESESVILRVASEKLGSAYEKLANSVEYEWGSPEENALSVLALKNYNYGLAKQGAFELLDESFGGDGECWPAGSCKVKDTAIALIALRDMGEDTSTSEKSENWILSSQNSISRGVWQLCLEAAENSCEIEVDGEISNVEVVGLKVKEMALPEGESVKVKVSCEKDVKAVKAEIIHTFLGKIRRYPLWESEENENESFLQIELNNKKCWGAGYKDECDFESTAYALWALGLLEVQEEYDKVKAVEWLNQNKNELQTLHYVLLGLLGENSVKNWLVNNQATDGHWDDSPLSLSGIKDSFVTGLAYSLFEEGSTIEISAASKAKEWLLGELETLSKKELASALYFVFSPDEIRPIISISPGFVKTELNSEFNLLVQNLGLRDVNISVKAFEQESFKLLGKGSAEKLEFNATQVGSSLLIVKYEGGFYNIPVIVSCVSCVEKGAEITDDIMLPSIKFESGGRDMIIKRISLDEKATEKVSLKNPYSYPLENVSLILGSELYKLVQLDKARISLEPGESVSIRMTINGDRDAEPGNYTGKLEAKNSIAVSLPIRVEVKGEEIPVGVPTALPDDERTKELVPETNHGRIILLMLLAVVLIIIATIIFFRFKRKPVEKGLKGLVSKIEERRAKPKFISGGEV